MRRVTRRSATTGLIAAGLVHSGFRRGLAQDSRAKIRVGIVPLISSGPVFVAKARGYFERVNLDAEFSYFADGALAIPSLIAGELDVAISTLNAAFFNAVSKGAPYKLFLDRGSEKPGSGSLAIAASNELVTLGMTSVDNMSLLKGKRISIQAFGGIDQYIMGVGLRRAGLDPRTDVVWNAGLTYPDIVKSMGAGQTDAAQIPLPLGFQVERSRFGKLVFAGYDIAPNVQLACWAVSNSFLQANKSAVVRFAMANIHAGRIFNNAASAKDPDIIQIIANETKLPKELISAAAPRWTWFAEDGLPNVESSMAQGTFWRNEMRLLSGRVEREQVFDLSATLEAKDRLARANPFV